LGLTQLHKFKIYASGWDFENYFPGWSLAEAYERATSLLFCRFRAAPAGSDRVFREFFTETRHVRMFDVHSA
jgi:hypothetical protein